jgi:hypothetical protein
MSIDGENATINNAAKPLLKVNNTFPALGGRGYSSVAEIKNLVNIIFFRLKIELQLKYQSRISLMPGKFEFHLEVAFLKSKIRVKVYTLGLK